VENPRVVEAFYKALLVASGIVCGVLSLYLWDATILRRWLSSLAILAIVFMVITFVWAVTVWPLVLLVAKIFGRSAKRCETRGPETQR